MTTAQSVTHRSPMTPETLSARAIQRAFDQRVRVFPLSGRPGCYVARSKTDPSIRYTLVVGPEGVIGCSCQGFAYRQSCKHAEALRNRLARRRDCQSRGS